ncbi:autotransporter outer membrane beta-barrel domain-containing protein [Pseudomonas sp. DWP3-1-2]|uniref:autotransporter outer membrane beta-barrel domain-containing protein n=1 Tax=Pseudomonas sp. DWP3-1-2 TaxID=2804645 RepID=UPI003CF9C6D4
MVIDNSSVDGVNGAAIKAINTFTTPAIANITLQNNSTLHGGNGNLLEVIGGSTANFSVDDSRLTGNLVSDDTSTLNVILQNQAQLTGDIVNSNTLAIKSGASWNMVGDGSARSLSMDGGRVSFGEGAFKTLTLGELSGSGVFDMRINLDNHAGDLLKVTGLASGIHTLKVQNTGVESVTPEVEPLLVVDTEGGEAQFGLLGGKADLGVYSYELEQRGDDWFIVGSGKTISPSTQSVLALFNAAPNIWNSELTTLRSRMGEVRGKPLGGAWMRSYGSRFNASTGDGVDYQQKQSGFALGVDAPLEVATGELSLGVMAGYSKNDLNLSRGTTGNVDSYYVGGYGTWLLDDGYYVDGVLKLNRFRNASKVAMSDGTKAKGDYESTGIGGSLELGRHITFDEGYFLEPYAQLSSVWVQGDSYRLDNGMQANNDRTQSVLGKVGTSAGRSIALKDGGVLKPYLRVALAQEFSRSNDVKVNDKRFDNDLFGSRAELGAGISVSLSERLQLHADFDYMKGKHVEQPWGANIGLKLAF